MSNLTAKLRRLRIGIDPGEVNIGVAFYDLDTKEIVEAFAIHPPKCKNYNEFIHDLATKTLPKHFPASKLKEVESVSIEDQIVMRMKRFRNEKDIACEYVFMFFFYERGIRVDTVQPNAVKCKFQARFDDKTTKAKMVEASLPHMSPDFEEHFTTKIPEHEKPHIADAIGTAIYGSVAVSGGGAKGERKRKRLNAE